MVHEDQVTCEGCGATITRLICGASPTHAQDPDYYLCESCGAADEDEDYPIGVYILTGRTETVLVTREYYERCVTTQYHEARGLGRMAD